MIYRRRSLSAELIRKALELSLAAPQVVAHRSWRMATAGYPLSARDRTEFTRMGSEKVEAYYQSWAAIWMQFYRIQMEFMVEWMTLPLRLASGDYLRISRPRGDLVTSVLAAGIGPMHSKAIANQKRLSRQRT